MFVLTYFTRVVTTPASLQSLKACHWCYDSDGLLTQPNPSMNKEVFAGPEHGKLKVLTNKKGQTMM